MATDPYSSHPQAQALRHHVTSLLSKVCILIGLSLPHIGQAQTSSLLTQGPRYSNCSVTESGPTTTFKFTATLINGLDFFIGVPQRTFSTWGVIPFFYDANGNLKPTPGTVTVRMRNKAHAIRRAYPSYPASPILAGPNSSGWVLEYKDNWQDYAAGNRDFEVVVNSTDIAGYPTIAVAIIVLSPSLPSEIGGPAYIDTKAVRLMKSPAPGMCNLIDPGVTSPPAKTLPFTVKVPDWDFGELIIGLTQPQYLNKNFCITHNPMDHASMAYEKLQIHVTNQNGTTTEGGKKYFKMLNTNQDGSYIPYMMHFNLHSLEGTTQYNIPRDLPFKLNPADFGYTNCYTPRYTTLTSSTTPAGDYTDVLTFTISNYP